MRANQTQSNLSIENELGLDSVNYFKTVSLKHMDGRDYDGTITSDSHHYLQMNRHDIPFTNEEYKDQFKAEIVTATRSVAQINQYSTDTKSISKPEVAYRMQLSIPQRIYRHLKENNLYIIPDNGMNIPDSEHSVFKIITSSEVLSFKPEDEYDDGLTPDEEVTVIVQSLYSLAAEARATFSLINTNKTSKIKSLKVITDKEFLLSSIEGRGSTTGEQYQDIDFTSPTYMAPFRVKVAGTKDKVELYTHWLDYTLTLPMNEVLRLNPIEIQQYYAQNPTTPTALEKSIGKLTADTIKFSQAYETNFSPFRYTKTEWDALTDKEKQHIAPNSIKADAVIAGIYLAGTITKEPMAAVDMLVNKWKNEHPNYQVKGSQEWLLFDKFKRLTASMSNVIRSQWAIGGGITEYHRAFSPWTASTPTVNTSTTETALIGYTSEYFKKVVDKIDVEPSSIQLSKLKLYGADTTISDPVLPALLTAEDIKNKAKNINVGSNKDLGYLTYVPFENSDKLTDFYKAIEKSETKTITITGGQPDSDWYVPLDPGPYDDYPSIKSNIQDGYPVHYWFHKTATDFITEVEAKALKERGYSITNKPAGWTFTYSKATKKLPAVLSTSFDGTTIRRDVEVEAFRFESITYSYPKDIVKGSLERKQVVFDKYTWGKQVQGFVPDRPEWEFVPQADAEVINYVSINAIYSGKYIVEVNYQDGSKVRLPEFPSNAVYDERITQDTIVL